MYRKWCGHFLLHESWLRMIFVGRERSRYINFEQEGPFKIFLLDNAECYEVSHKQQSPHLEENAVKKYLIVDPKNVVVLEKTRCKKRWLCAFRHNVRLCQFCSHQYGPNHLLVFRQDTNGVSSFSRCLNETFCWRNDSAKTLVH